MGMVEQESVLNKCQIFTPEKYANKLLEYAGYKKNLFGKKILENSCGDGEILKVIVNRYINSLLKMKTLDEIKFGLENDIYGIELDKEHYSTCLKNLDMIAGTYGIRNVNWKVFNENALKKEWDKKFDYIIGNPPYISYKDINDTIRKELKEKYTSCKKGKFDYYYAFIEESLNCLSSFGKFVYLIPNSIFKNEFGEELRKIILPSLSKIVDYKSHKIFKNVSTTSAILICDKRKKKKSMLYFDYENKNQIKILKENLNKKWIFVEEKNDLLKDNFKKFGDYFKVSMGVATLSNKSFIINDYKEDEIYVYKNGMKIEREILKRGASPSGMKKGKNELIIFPYKYIEDKLYKFSEEEFGTLFPEAKNYLLHHYEALMERDADSSAKWFEYGRSQALQYLNTDKLILSTLITNRVETYILNDTYIPYSGIYIIAKSKLPLKLAQQILESQEFYKYIKNVGKNASGKTIMITAKDINNYYF